VSDGECRDALAAGLDEYRLGDRVSICVLPDEPRVSHLVAVERPGPAVDGRCYSMRGLDITEHHADVEGLFRRRGTVGIGDGGNEVGMGKLPAGMIARNVPHGAKIACRVATDHLLVAGISNWGAWALGAGLCLLRGAALNIDLDQEYRLLERMAKEGRLVNAGTGRHEPAVDGVPFDQYIQPLIEMRKVAEA
jgi:hypothetical protein